MTPYHNADENPPRTSQGAVANRAERALPQATVVSPTTVAAHAGMPYVGGKR